MNIQETIKQLTTIRDELKTAIKNGDHILEGLQKKNERVIPIDVPTGHYPNAAGHIDMAIKNLNGFLEKTAEVEAENKKLQAQ